MVREAKVSRKTKETDITVNLYLDGTGKSTISVDDQFLRHMLETLSKYSGFDLTLQASGDNDHHLVEDVAISLGTALRQALSEGAVERIASSMVPMDDALVTVAVDLVDRPYAEIDCPDPLWHHFFRSFAMSSGITLHVLVERGMDDHHIIEASFKALGLAMKKAVVPRGDILSTKDAVKFRSG